MGNSASDALVFFGATGDLGLQEDLSRAARHGGVDPVAFDTLSK
jgi:hypothetical protein